MGPIGRSSLLPALLAHPGARHINPFLFKGFTANLYGGTARSEPNNDNAGGTEAGERGHSLGFQVTVLRPSLRCYLEVRETFVENPCQTLVPSIPLLLRMLPG